MIGIMMNNELGSIWKEAIMDSFKVLLHLPEGIEEYREHLSG
jgi:hypothetical protein